MVVSTVKDNRSATSLIPKPRLEPNSGARRVAATAIAWQLAIRKNSMYSWLNNHHGFEFPSIFEWRGFPGEGRQNYRIGRTGLVYRHGVGSRRQPLQRELNPA